MIKLQRVGGVYYLKIYQKDVLTVELSTVSMEFAFYYIMEIMKQNKGTFGQSLNSRLLVK